MEALVAQSAEVASAFKKQSDLSKLTTLSQTLKNLKDVAADPQLLQSVETRLQRALLAGASSSEPSCQETGWQGAGDPTSDGIKRLTGGGGERVTGGWGGVRRRRGASPIWLKGKEGGGARRGQVKSRSGGGGNGVWTAGGSCNKGESVVSKRGAQEGTGQGKWSAVGCVAR